MLYDKLTRHTQDANLNKFFVRVKRQQNLALIAIACRGVVFALSICLSSRKTCVWKWLSFFLSSMFIFSSTRFQCEEFVDVKEILQVVYAHE